MTMAYAARSLAGIALLLGASTLSLSSGCTRGMAPIDAGDAGPTTPGLTIVPADATLLSVDGATPRVALRAIRTANDGSTEAVTPEHWSIGDERIATLTIEADVAWLGATALAGGAVEVLARYTDPDLGVLTASAVVRVRVERTMPPDPSIPASVIDRFHTLPEGNDPFEAAAIAYPLDGARMPGNVVAPEVQWFPREGSGDGYRVVLEGEFVSVTAYAYDDGRRFRASSQVEPAAWRIIADSTRSAELTIRVDRLTPSATAIAMGEPVTVWLSEDGLFGTVYYWQVRTDPQASDVLRLDAASGARRSVFDGESGTCVGCHSLTTDGRRLAATQNGRSFDWVTTFVDPAGSAAPPPDLIDPIEPGYHFLSFSPDGTRALASRATDGEGADGTELVLLDGMSGLPLASTGLPTTPAGYPAWSPDGDWVAWMEGGGDGPRGTTEATRIAVAPVLEDDAFGAAVVVHDGASLDTTSLEGGRTDSRPTWSPDASWIAFAHGDRSVSATEIGESAPRAALYLIAREGGEPVRLERGMGREGPVDAFWPVFSPFVTEEPDGTRLFWLAFYSRADYGNDRAGTADTDRRQLWVMAIDPERTAAGEDPSYPPYWLPGQDVLADDIAALWAPTACRTRGDRCTASSECCSGECAAADPTMPDVLTCEPPTACRRYGESCDQASDCCDGLCTLGVCGYEVPF
jgi:Tol biopolymer transport system component